MFVSIAISSKLTILFLYFIISGTLYGAVAASDPVGSNPVAVRSTVIPQSTMQQIVGNEVTEEEEE